MQVFFYFSFFPKPTLIEGFFEMTEVLCNVFKTFPDMGTYILFIGQELPTLKLIPTWDVGNVHKHVNMHSMWGTRVHVPNALSSTK